MYSIFCDDQCIYDDTSCSEELQLIDPKLELEVNSAGTFTCTLEPNTIAYKVVKRLSSTLTIYRRDKVLWEGRVIQENSDFYNDRKITCEGALAFLNDTIQEPAAYFNNTVKDFLTALLKVHNKKVKKYDRSKMFYVGKVTVVGNVGYDKTAEDYESFADRFKKDNKNSKVWYFEVTDYETTLDCISNKLVDKYGGFLQVRVDNDTGKRYLDYLADYKSVNTQEINFGDNLLSFVRNWDLSNLVTVVLPLGATKDDKKSTSYIKNMEDYNKYLKEEEGRRLSISKGSSFDNIAVLEYSKKNKFPKTGVLDCIYLDATTGYMWAWNGDIYKLVEYYVSKSKFPTIGNTNRMYYDQFEGDLYEYMDLGYMALYEDKKGFPKKTLIDKTVYFKSLADYTMIGGTNNPIKVYNLYISECNLSSGIVDPIYTKWTTKYYQVMQYANRAGFPSTGEKGYIYADKSTRYLYEWTGSTYNVWRLPTDVNVAYYDSKEKFPQQGEINKVYMVDPPAYSSTTTYSVGAIVEYGNSSSIYSRGQLYKCKTAISTPEAFNASKWNKLQEYAGQSYIWDSSTSKYYEITDGYDDSEHIASAEELITIPVSATETTLPVTSDPEFPAFTQYVTLTGDGKAEYVKSNTALAKYGWIEEVVHFDGVINPSVLLRKAKEYLSDNQFEHMKIEVTAYDLGVMSSRIKSLNVLDCVRCRSIPHGMDAMFPVKKISLALANPENTTYYLDRETTDVKIINRSTVTPTGEVESIGTEATVTSKAAYSTSFKKYSRPIPLTTAAIKSQKGNEDDIKKLEFDEGSVLEEITEELPWDGTLKFNDEVIPFPNETDISVAPFETSVDIRKITPVFIESEDEVENIPNDVVIGIDEMSDDLIMNKLPAHLNCTWGDLAQKTWEQVYMDYTW